MHLTSYNLAQSLIRMAMDGDRTPEEVARLFGAFVARYRLESYIPNIVRYLAVAERRAHEQEALRIETAHPMTDSMAQRIGKSIGAPTQAPVEMSISVSLIAGFVAAFKGVVYDASIKTQLGLLQNELRREG